MIKIQLCVIYCAIIFTSLFFNSLLLCMIGITSEAATFKDIATTPDKNNKNMESIENNIPYNADDDNNSNNDEPSSNNAPIMPSTFSQSSHSFEMDCNNNDNNNDVKNLKILNDNDLINYNNHNNINNNEMNNNYKNKKYKLKSSSGGGGGGGGATASDDRNDLMNESTFMETIDALTLNNENISNRFHQVPAPPILTKLKVKLINANGNANERDNFMNVERDDDDKQLNNTYEVVNKNILENINDNDLLYESNDNVNDDIEQQQQQQQQQHNQGDEKLNIDTMGTVIQNQNHFDSTSTIIINEQQQQQKSRNTVKSDDEEKSAVTTDHSLNLTVEENPIPVFSEWAKQKIEADKQNMEQENDTLMSKKNLTSGQLHKTTSIKLRQKNYASPDCGAKIIAANVESTSIGSVLTMTKDEYLLSPCTSRIWFVVELCEAIQPQIINLANFELFSSSPKNFTVSISNRFPTRDWSNIGRFLAKDERDIQAFNLNSHLFGKYIRVDIHSHYNSEHFCPISLFRVFGISEFEAFETENRAIDDNDDDDDDDVVDDDGNHSHEDGIEDDGDLRVNRLKPIDNGNNVLKTNIDLNNIPEFGDESVLNTIEFNKKNGNILKSASDAVISIVKKAAAALTKSSDNKTASMSNGHDDDNHINELGEVGRDRGPICITPNFIIICDKCSESLTQQINELITCNYFMLISLLNIQLIRNNIYKSYICASVVGLHFKQYNNNIFMINDMHKDYISHMFPVSYIAALCNLLGNMKSSPEHQNQKTHQINYHSTDTNIPLRLELNYSEDKLIDKNEPLQIHKYDTYNDNTIHSNCNNENDLTNVDIIKVNDSVNALNNNLKIDNIQSTQVFKTVDEDANVPQIPTPPTFPSDTNITPTAASYNVSKSAKQQPHSKNDIQNEIIKDSMPPTPIDIVLEKNIFNIIDEDQNEINQSDGIAYGAKQTETQQLGEGINDYDNVWDNVNLTILELKTTTTTTTTTTIQPPLTNDIGDNNQQATGAHKFQSESIFLRLSNRIKALEQNMSLSGQYLEELSRRYKKQVEELQHSFAKTLHTIEEQNRQRIESEQFLIVENQRLRFEFNKLYDLLFSGNNLITYFLGFIFLQFIIIWCIFKLLLRQYFAKQNNINVSQQPLKKQEQLTINDVRNLEFISKNFKHKIRRKSDESGRQTEQNLSSISSIKANHLRRPSNEAMNVTTSCNLINDQLLLLDPTVVNYKMNNHDDNMPDRFMTVKNDNVVYDKLNGERKVIGMGIDSTGNNNANGKKQKRSKLHKPIGGNMKRTLSLQSTGTLYRKKINQSDLSDLNQFHIDCNNAPVLDENYELYVPATDLSYNEFMPDGPYINYLHDLNLNNNALLLNDNNISSNCISIINKKSNVQMKNMNAIDNNKSKSRRLSSPAFLKSSFSRNKHESKKKSASLMLNSMFELPIAKNEIIPSNLKTPHEPHETTTTNWEWVNLKNSSPQSLISSSQKQQQQQPQPDYSNRNLCQLNEFNMTNECIMNSVNNKSNNNNQTDHQSHQTPSNSKSAVESSFIRCGDDQDVINHNNRKSNGSFRRILKKIF